jgi:hypothetical protein
MAARLGFSPGLRLGQESSSQPPSGPAPLVPEVGTPRSRPEVRGQTEGVLDPSAGGVEVPPGSQAEAHVPHGPLPMPAAQCWRPPLRQRSSRLRRRPKLG